MALGDIYDEDDPYGEPPPTPPPSGGAYPGGKDAQGRDRRQTIVDGIIIPDFTAIAQRPPTEQEIDESYQLYEQFGGDVWRAKVQERFPAAGGGGGSTLATLALPERGPQYEGPMSPNLTDFGPAPDFEWQPTTREHLFADPSYQFRLGEGERALQQSAAARGVLRTGGTLKDILGYGQNFASQEYGNVDARRFRDALAGYQPKIEDWRLRSGATINAGELAFQRAWDAYKFGADDTFRRGAFNADDAFRRDDAILRAGSS
jgi:hypothetical protein